MHHRLFISVIFPVRARPDIKMSEYMVGRQNFGIERPIMRVALDTSRFQAFLFGFPSQVPCTNLMSVPSACWLGVPPGWKLDDLRSVFVVHRVWERGL